MVVAMCVAMVMQLQALPTEYYAANSVLKEGNWAKIKVNGTGMHLVTTADLKALGFSDPAKVNVYGTGGRMVKEELTVDLYDDLPLLPCVRTSKGILFYGVDNLTWKTELPFSTYTHDKNPYNEESYYFLSDREVTQTEMAAADQLAGGNGEEKTYFYARLLHENELGNPVGYGRWIFGEDFRSQKNRSFSFDLPDRVVLPDDSVYARIRFIAKTTNGNSTLTLTNNGEPAKPYKIEGISNDDFFSIADIPAGMSGTFDKYTLGIDYNYTGVLHTARLDYIEVFYHRELKLNNGQLHFYSNFAGEKVVIGSAPENIIIWDVTNPCDPKMVKYEREGNSVSFVPATGYREYIAFDSSNTGETVARVGKVVNQDIHGMESPDMVIVAYPQYREAAERIANMHRSADDMTVYVLTPESIYNEFSGGHKDAMAFRKMLKMWYDREDPRKIKYCLLMGRGSYDTKMVTPTVKSAGYEPLPLWQSPTGLNEGLSYSTDDIIGMLDDVTEKDFRADAAQLRVAVGRFPVSSVREANEIADKICEYVLSPDYGTWRNRVLVIADDQDNGVHLRQSESVIRELSITAPHYQYDKLYLDSYPLESTSVGMSYPKAKERMMRAWNDGVAYTNYAGHASSNSWTHEKLLTWEDITSISNSKFSFLVAATCSFGHWDGDSQSGAEVMVLNPKAGFIGALVPSRTVYIGLNEIFNIQLAKWLLADESDGKVARIGDAVVKGKNAVREDNRLRYCLIADPALRIPKAENRIEIESFNGEDIREMTEIPEFKAMSKIKVAGSVKDGAGEVIADFNGYVQLDLFDAEKVVESYGNGKDGAVMPFNDRTTKLASVSAKVTAGKWETTVFLPLEIENNYSPARIVAYAWSSKGKEGQGSFDNFYVYGFPDGDAEDVTGPNIERMYLNYPQFEEGSSVGENPVLHVSMIDESGINLSGAGVGHKMAIVLDRHTVFDDVDSYYQADSEREGAGYVTYPLNSLSTGEHTITFKVYDNATNVSERTLTFNVATTLDPVIRELYTDVNPASESVTFTVLLNSPNTKMNCRLEVFDLMGKRVWVSEESQQLDIAGSMQKKWDLCDSAGRRVPRGIYLYRATVETAEGRYSSKTKKLAVTAQ